MAATPSPIFFRKSTFVWEAADRGQSLLMMSLTTLSSVHLVITLLLMNKEPFTVLTSGGAALSSRPGGSRLLLGHSLILVLVPHAVSHPLHPFSPWKPLLQAQTQLSITASSATATDQGSHTEHLHDFTQWGTSPAGGARWAAEHARCAFLEPGRRSTGRSLDTPNT